MFCHPVKRAFAELANAESKDRYIGRIPWILPVQGAFDSSVARCAGDLLAQDDKQ